MKTTLSCYIFLLTILLTISCTSYYKVESNSPRNQIIRVYPAKVILREINGQALSELDVRGWGVYSYGFPPGEYTVTISVSTSSRKDHQFPVKFSAIGGQSVYLCQGYHPDSKTWTPYAKVKDGDTLAPPISQC